MARATKQIKQELQSWLKNVMTEEEKYKDLENRLWKLGCRALTELTRVNETVTMDAFSRGAAIPDYINHFMLRVKFEIQDRKEKKTWTPEK